MPKLYFVSGRGLGPALPKKKKTKAQMPKKKPAAQNAAKVKIPKKKPAPEAAKYNNLVLRFYNNGQKFVNTGNRSVYNKYNLENMMYAMILSNAMAVNHYNRKKKGQWYNMQRNQPLTKNFLINNLELTYPNITPANYLNNYKKNPQMLVSRAKLYFPNRFK